MDVEAVITDNRTTDKKKVNNLYISERIANYSGIDGTDEFYKKKVYLVVVYNEGKKVAEEYVKFCSKRENYEWMDQKLSEMEIKWLPKEVFDKDKINFGYEHINQLARVLQDHHERIDDETKARLAETIYHLDKDTANELARQSGNCIGYYFAMLALLDYQSQDVSIKWDLKNIIPTEYMAILSISNNSKKISKLKTKLENAELYRVLGWKAADFDKKIMGIQSF